jgi:hypothetical protein
LLKLRKDIITLKYKGQLECIDYKPVRDKVLNVERCCPVSAFFLFQQQQNLFMKPELILKCLFPAMFGLLATGLEHEKSFLMQDSASTVWSIAIHEESLPLTSSIDIVQKDIQTGAIQRSFRAHKKPIISFLVTND